MDTFSGFEKTVDEDMKKKWDEAKHGKEMTTTMITVKELVLHEFNQAINYAMGDLVRLVQRYDRLSFAVSYSVQVKSAIRSLEARERMTVEEDKLERVKECLDHMRRRLELLNKVEDAKKGVSG